jgi:MoxR-like ATPase
VVAALGGIAHSVKIEPINVQERLRTVGYVADAQLSMSIALMTYLGRPLLLEGVAGVGKTEVAVALSKAYGMRLIRLQCWEGLDAQAAIYEWNYQRQLLAVRVAEGRQTSASTVEQDIFSEQFLIRRPLLQAISQPEPPVLLLDEIDRADDGFEAFLLELLATFQITIPELGTIQATSIPLVVLTSNGTRDLSDALRRRCLFHYLNYPDADRERAIIAARLPEVSDQLSAQIVRFVQALRARGNLVKPPGVSETLDWARALTGLGVATLGDEVEVVAQSLVCLFKTEADRRAAAGDIRALVDSAA